MGFDSSTTQPGDSTNSNNSTYEERISIVKILVPVDNIDYAHAIEDFIAGYFTLMAEDQIEVLRVLDRVADAVTWPSGAPQQECEAFCQQVCDRFKRRFPGASVESKVVHGEAVSEEILKEAERWNASIIVMGTHGKTGLVKMVLGSVSSTVGGRATCPVAVVQLKKKSTPHANACEVSSSAR